MNEDRILKRLRDPNLISSTLLGAVAMSPSKKAKKSTSTNSHMKLLYATTCHVPNQKIKNVLQLASNILNESKIIFYSTILFLLSVINPALGVACYKDTDR